MMFLRTHKLELFVDSSDQLPGLPLRLISGWGEETDSDRHAVHTDALTAL